MKSNVKYNYELILGYEVDVITCLSDNFTTTFGFLFVSWGIHLLC